MLPTRSLRRGPTLEAVREAVRAEFGAGARIVSAERVTSAGIGGLFRRAHVEAVVEVADPTTPPVARVAIADGPAVRVGIAALLADAEAAEDRIARSDGTATARADAFASVLDGFVADGIAPHGAAAASAPASVAADASAPLPVPMPVRGPAGAGPESGAGPVDGGGSRLQDGAGDQPGGAVPPIPSAPVLPAVRSADGDLVLLVGRPTDVDAAAGVFAMRHALQPTDAADRRAGILARAAGVQAGHALLGVAAWDDVATTAGLAPDQVWVVVDVGRKHEDTVAMVSAVASRTPVAGIVAIGAGETATPESVHRLGVPVLSLG